MLSFVRGVLLEVDMLSDFPSYRVFRVFVKLRKSLNGYRNASLYFTFPAGYLSHAMIASGNDSRCLLVMEHEMRGQMAYAYAYSTSSD